MKKLDERAMENELLGSVFFKPQQQDPIATQSAASPDTKSESTLTDSIQAAKHQNKGEARELPFSASPEHSNLELQEIGKPYDAQTYRFRPDEMAWLRDEAYSMSRRLGFAVYQNTILRVGLLVLRRQSQNDADNNILLEELRKLKK